MSRRSWSEREDSILKELAGIKTADEIGVIIGRPKGGVHHRIKKLGLDGRMIGERHWNAKLTHMATEMIGALYDAGFTVNEIHRSLVDGLPVSLSQVNAVAACRSRTAMRGFKDA